MRFREFVAFCATVLANLAIGRPVDKTASPVGRDLLGLLGVEEPPLGTQKVAITTAPLTATGTGHESAVSTTLASIQSTVNGPTSTTAATSSSTALGLKVLTSVTPSNTGPDPSTVTFSETPYNIGYVSEAPTTPPGELTEWKVIGIAVITITFIATVILGVAFFDSWWGFVRDSFCGRHRKAGEKIGGETLVPDWEKRSWEFRLANEDGHRYPTIPSLESIVREKEQVKPLRVWGDTDIDIKSPEEAYGGIS